MYIPTSNWQYIPLLKKERIVSFDSIKKIFIDETNVERFNYFEIIIETRDYNRFAIKDKVLKIGEAEKFLSKLKSLNCLSVKVG